MKKLLTITLCIMILFSFSSCNKKQDEDISIKDIPTAAADKDEAFENSADEFEQKYSGEEDEEYINHKTKQEDMRSERERVEIENSLRDAEALVKDGAYEDAMMIIKSLKTRKLSKEESNRIIELQKKMTEISD